VANKDNFYTPPPYCADFHEARSCLLLVDICWRFRHRI
jgi:hypothetical protein